MLNFAKIIRILRIAVNTRLLLPNKLEGIGWVMYETLRRMVLAHPEVEFYFLFDRKPDPKYIFAPNVKPVVLFPQARHPFLYIWYFELSVARALRRIKPDLYYSPDGYLCLHTDVPSVAHFHDLSFEHFPNDMPAIDLWHYKKYFPQYARKARRIITVSEFSKKDICDCYQIEPDKIDVAYNGANEIFEPIEETEKTKVREQYAQGKPYFMFVGSLHPRKNLARLFPAYDLFRQRGSKEVKLLIVGEKRWWTDEIKQAYESMTFKDDVVFLGHLCAEELHKVTAASYASVYVSYFEGFGIPIVEAFRCKVPVITSNVTSMPEVAGDAALLVDPFDVNSIANAMVKIQDENLRFQLIKNAWLRKKKYSWDTTAESVWQSLMKSF
ncbi:MAG: glycosyltransferase family 1 protein [Bacteroidetes bacterium]|nr:glycosyltransferase family 1 protein [Bacteroidota bacterium]